MLDNNILDRILQDNHVVWSLISEHHYPAAGGECSRKVNQGEVDRKSQEVSVCVVTPMKIYSSRVGEGVLS